MHHIKACGFLLRPFEERDASQFAQAVRESTGSVGPWMPWCHSAYNEANAFDWFKICHQDAASGSAYEFGVFSEDGSEFIGGAGLNQINSKHAFCNLGYWVRQSRQRQGVATACVRSLSTYGFSTLKLHRIEIVVAVGNEPSSGVALKSGALLECVAQNRLIVGGKPVAANIYSLVPPQKA